MTGQKVNPIPEGMPTVTPHLVCDGAAEAIEFYKLAFGATDLGRAPASDGKLMHALIRIGDSPVMLVDEFPEMGNASPKSLAGTPVTMHVYVEDVDSAFERAITAGAQVIMPVADMFWGDRYGVLKDPFGHRWSIATHIRDVTDEEIAAAAAQTSAEGGQCRGN